MVDNYNKIFMMKKHLLKISIVLLICIMHINAFAQEYIAQDYIWVGPTNGDFFNESNWKNGAGASPATGSIDPNKSINLVLQLSCKVTVTQNIDLGTGKIYLIHGSLTAPAIIGGEVVLNENAYLKLTTSIANSTNTIINFRSPISWAETERDRPSEIAASFLSRFKIWSSDVSFPGSIRLDNSYYIGTVVRPNDDNAKALIVYNQTSLGGTATELSINQVYSGSSIPNSMNNNIKSFRLRKGYMVTMAVNADGTGKSKVFIASDEDMIVNTLPAVLSGGVSFVRVVPWNWVKKRGTGGDLPSMKITWYYDWGRSRNSNPGREYVPMAWGRGAADDDADITLLRNKYMATHVLSFNEPDDCHAQSGQYFSMCVTDTAVKYHKNLMKSGLRIVSPACREEGATTWLKTFYDKATAQDIRIDVIAVHWYDWGGNPVNTPNADHNQIFNRFKTYLTNVYNTYGLPIWITEFNANPNRNTNVHLEFMKLALPYLDNLSYVERYAWFEPFPVNGATTGNANFYDNNNNLTDIGKFYDVQWTSYKSIPLAIWGGPNNLDNTTSGVVDATVCVPYTGPINNTSDAIEENLAMSIYPNPATNEINVLVNGLDIKEITIYDINGKLIKTSPTSTNIDISTLPNGIYFIKADHHFSKFIKH
jgi:hypothetical protein